MFKECSKGHAQKRVSFNKPDTRHEAFETGRGWRGCRLSVTDGKKVFPGKSISRLRTTTAITRKKKKKKKKTGW